MSEINVKKEFAQYGKYCFILAILCIFAVMFELLRFVISVLQYVSWVLQLFIIIVMILSILNVGKAGKTLKNDNLLGCRNFIIIGGILIGIGLAAILSAATVQSSDPGSSEAVQIYTTYGILILFGLILIIIGVIIEILAWVKLRRFFNNNMSMFPNNIGKNAKSGATLCLVGAILSLTIILVIIGFILYAIGYFKLSSLKRLE